MIPNQLLIQTYTKMNPNLSSYFVSPYLAYLQDFIYALFIVICQWKAILVYDNKSFLYYIMISFAIPKMI